MDTRKEERRGKGKDVIKGYLLSAFTAKRTKIPLEDGDERKRRRKGPGSDKLETNKEEKA